jgi:electron transport complex protein RnfG
MKKIRPGVLVFLMLGLASAALLTWMAERAEPQIKENQEIAMRQFVEKMIPESATQQTIQTFELLAPNYLNMGDMQTASRIFDKNKPIQVVYRALSKKAYQSRIGVLAAFDSACTITQVDILTHQETPGLGDQFKKDDNAWLKSLAGKTSATQWALKPKGDIDTWTGATVTPEAIIKTLESMQLLCMRENALLFSHEGILYLEVGKPENSAP